MPTVFPVVMFEDKNDSSTVFNKRLSLANTTMVSVGPFRSPDDEKLIKSELIQALQYAGFDDLTVEWTIRQGTKTTVEVDWVLFLDKPIA